VAKTRYDGVAMILHWTIAFAIFFMLIQGWLMVEKPFGDDKFADYQLHKSLGVTIITASLLRLGWRLLNPPPAPLDGPPLEKLAAALGHWALYGLMIGIPISGWLMVSASPWGIPTVVWGVVDLPHLPMLADLPAEAKEPTEKRLKTIHLYAGYALAGLMAVHILAAMRHSLVLGDNTLARMLPFIPLLKK